MKYPKISLAAARVNAGYSQKEAARLIGVSVATLQNYESGKTTPNWGTVNKIEEVYRFPLDYIFLPPPLAFSEGEEGGSSETDLSTTAEKDAS